MTIKTLFKREEKDTLPPVKCKKCGVETEHDFLFNNYMICPECGAYQRVGARDRIDMICDKRTFKEHDSELKSHNIIDFPDYDAKLEKAEKASGENDAVLCGTCKINGNPCALFVMDSTFMMGSMGTVVGEKITRIFEYATKNHLPVVGFTTSGGARMQEGVFSLMQMAKVSAAVKFHSMADLLYITVLTDPTTGGVTASFAMEGDIILAEPGALVGFAGQRVIEQTTGEKLPEGFQRSEFILEHGFCDSIVPRMELKETLAKLLSLHSASQKLYKDKKTNN